MIKVVGINGSPHRDGNTALIIKKVFAELESKGIATEMLHLADLKLQGCTACYSCFQKMDERCAIDDGINDFIAKMIEADGIILGSPTYFADITPALKAFIDRAGMVSVANGGIFKYKAGAAVVAVRRGGAIHAFDTINHFLHIGQMFLVGASYWNMVYGLEPGDAAKDDEGIENMKSLGQNMAWLLNKIKS